MASLLQYIVVGNVVDNVVHVTNLFHRVLTDMSLIEGPSTTWRGTCKLKNKAMPSSCVNGIIISDVLSEF